MLIMIITDETDEAAHAKFELYNKGTDMEALPWMQNQSGKDVKADDFSTAKRMVSMSGNSNDSMATLIGSWESVAKMLDETAMQPINGIMLTFDDFVEGVEDFGRKIQPLIKNRVNTVEHWQPEATSLERPKRSEWNEPFILCDVIDASYMKEEQ